LGSYGKKEGKGRGELVVVWSEGAELAYLEGRPRASKTAKTSKLKRLTLDLSVDSVSTLIWCTGRVAEADINASSYPPLPPLRHATLASLESIYEINKNDRN